MNEIAQAAAVIGAGVVSGFLNTAASAGSAVTLPLLIFLGLPPNVANGTNRLSLVTGALTGTIMFHKAGVIDWGRSWKIAIPVLIGTFLGAQIATIMPSDTVADAIIAAVIMALILILTNLKKILNTEQTADPQLNWKNMAALFLVGVWTGFIVLDGATYMLLALVLGVGYDLMRANALKVLLLFYTSLAAIAIFWVHGEINLSLGLYLALGSILGSWLGGKISTHQHAKVWISRIMILVIVGEIIQLGIKYKLL